MIWNRHYDMRYFGLFFDLFQFNGNASFRYDKADFPSEMIEISYPLACVQTEHHFSCHIKNEGMTVGENYGKTKAKDNGHFLH